MIHPWGPDQESQVMTPIRLPFPLLINLYCRFPSSIINILKELGEVRGEVPDTPKFMNALDKNISVSTKVPLPYPLPFFFDMVIP